MVLGFDGGWLGFDAGGAPVEINWDLGVLEGGGDTDAAAEIDWDIDVGASADAANSVEIDWDIGYVGSILGLGSRV